MQWRIGAYAGRVGGWTCRLLYQRDQAGLLEDTVSIELTGGYAPGKKANIPRMTEGTSEAQLCLVSVLARTTPRPAGEPTQTTEGFSCRLGYESGLSDFSRIARPEILGCMKGGRRIEVCSSRLGDRARLMMDGVGVGREGLAPKERACNSN